MSANTSIEPSCRFAAAASSILFQEAAQMRRCQSLHCNIALDAGGATHRHANNDQCILRVQNNSNLYRLEYDIGRCSQTLELSEEAPHA